MIKSILNELQNTKWQKEVTVKDTQNLTYADLSIKKMALTYGTTGIIGAISFLLTNEYAMKRIAGIMTKINFIREASFMFGKVIL